MKIDQKILNIIDSGSSIENIYYLPSVNLERKTYLKINKVLEALGGKWNRKEKGHVFNSPIENIIENVILTGEVLDKKKELQFFETPDTVAKILCNLAEVEKANTILEPSAGQGALLKEIRKYTNAKIFWYEIDKENMSKIQSPNSVFMEYDFIKANPFIVDCIIMNPPFTKQQDIEHVSHALKFLKISGILVSVMSPSIKFRTNKKTKNFLDLIGNYKYEIHDLPPGSFKQSGTMVNTVILKIIG